MTTPTEVAAEITRIYQSRKRPFPYKDLYKIQDEFGGVFEDVIPDLDMFASALCGYANGGQELLRLSSQEAKVLQYICERSFFEKYPQYKAAEQSITADSTPDLYTLLQELELIRSKLKVFAKADEN